MLPPFLSRIVISFCCSLARSFHSVMPHCLFIHTVSLNKIVAFFPSALFLAINLFRLTCLCAHNVCCFVWFVACVFVSVCMNSFWLCYTIFFGVIIAITRARERKKKIINFSPENVWIDGKIYFIEFDWNRNKKHEQSVTNFPFSFFLVLVCILNSIIIIFLYFWRLNYFFSIHRNEKKGLIGWCQCFDMLYIL